ncbi:hypothetical protein GQX74_009941 [Glossina fuscipes]|nr:hypothetical protein GQX74_009941 [Glossina fuscipes]
MIMPTKIVDMVCNNSCLWIHKNNLGHGNGSVGQLQDITIWTTSIVGVMDDNIAGVVPTSAFVKPQRLAQEGAASLAGASSLNSQWIPFIYGILEICDAYYTFTAVGRSLWFPD